MSATTVQNQFPLPDLGEGLHQATIREWKVSVGDTVKNGDPMVEVETAKAVVEIPCPCDATIDALHGDADEMLEVGMPLVTITHDPDDWSNDNNIHQNHNDSPAPTESIAPASKTTTNNDGPRIMPAIRKLAEELEVDISTITGSGPNGMIRRADIIDAQEAAQKKPASTKSNLNMHQQEMYKSMSQAHNIVARTTLFDDANISRWKSFSGMTIKLIQAVTHACRVVPQCNSHFDNDTQCITEHDHINLALAVDVGEMLYMPVIHQTDKISVEDIRAKLDAFKLQAAERRFMPTDLVGGTVLLSNIGMIQGRYATPMVVPPMVASIAVGKPHHQLVMNDAGEVEKGQFLPLSFSFDHRVISGRQAAEFLKAMIEFLSV